MVSYRRPTHCDQADNSVKQSGHAILYVTPRTGGPIESYLITLRELAVGTLREDVVIADNCSKAPD